MEWRTTRMNSLFQVSMITLGLAATLPSALAAGVFDPDQKEAISRFGEYTDYNGRILRSSDMIRSDDAEDVNSPGADSSLVRRPASLRRADRNSDLISTHSAAARPSSADRVPQPLGTARRNGVQEVAVIAGDLGFFPRTVFVTQDIPVRMYVTGASRNSLCIMMDSFNVRKQVKSQSIEELSFMPDQPGRFRFYCPVNGAEGYVVVREFGRGEDS
jgi:hypothetical protein